jgi:hypothetical protein
MVPGRARASSESLLFGRPEKPARADKSCEGGGDPRRKSEEGSDRGEG